MIQRVIQSIEKGYSTVSLYDHNLTSEELENLLEAIIGLSVDEICLEQTCLGDIGTVRLARAIPELSWLQKLRLTDCDIRDEGAAALAAAMSQNQTIDLLNLGSNEIGDVGAKAIANCLCQNTALLWLSLDSNMIGLLGAQALGRSLGQNSALQEFYISDNVFGSKGTEAIIEGMRQNFSILLLNDFNNLDQIVDNCVRRKNTFREILCRFVYKAGKKFGMLDTMVLYTIVYPFLAV